MAWYDYENATAFDPYTREGAPNATGQIYDRGDINFENALTAVLMATGLQVAELVADTYCQLPGFQVEDRNQVVFKSGDFTKVLNTTTPLVGPAGPAVNQATDNGDGTVTFLLEDGTPAATVALPEGPQGDQGPQGLPATGAADDDAAIKTFLTTPGTQTNTALSSTTASAIAAQAEPITVNGKRAIRKDEYRSSAKDYLAAGDGVTNDRPALLNTQTAAGTSREVYLPPGVYAVSGGAVPFVSGYRYIGHGATIKTLASSAPAAITGLTDVIVEGITFDGNGLSSAALSMENSIGITLRSCKVRGGLDYGLYLFNGTDIDLNAVIATANGNGGGADAGFYLNGTDIRARSLMAKDNLGNGFRLHGNSTSQGKRINLNDCHAVSNDLHGFVGASSGGTQYAPLYVSLAACQAHENGTGGTYSGFALHYLNRMTASGLIAANNAEHGIVLMDQEKAQLTDFHTEDNGKAGLRLQSDFSMAQNSRSGVRNSIISGGYYSGNWTANTSDSANYGAIQIDGTRKTKITDQLIIGTRGVAVRIDDPANYTDSSDLELGFTSYDNTLGHYGNAQPAGGIYGSYRTTAGVTTIG